MSTFELATFVTRLISFMTRDSAEFIARGVLVVQRTALETLNTAFKSFPSDEEYQGLVKIETDAKKVLKKSIVIKVQNISGYMEQAFGTKSGQYKRLAIAGFQTLSDSEFVFRVREVVRIATEYLATLTPLGCTQVKLDALTADTTAFEAKMTSVNDAKAIRVIKTAERITKGNEIYTLTVKYCKVGKLIWENVNATKYNDYVIYDKTPSVPKKVTGMIYDPPSDVIKWFADMLAVKYSVESKSKEPTGPIPDWIEIYNGADNRFVFGKKPGSWLFRCRGINDKGAGAWSDELEVVIE